MYWRLCNEPETLQLRASAARAPLALYCELLRRSDTDDAMYWRLCNEPETLQLRASAARALLALYCELLRRSDTDDAMN